MHAARCSSHGLTVAAAAGRKTEEGFNIYTEEELNIGKGGNTADCPFDCNCCY